MTRHITKRSTTVAALFAAVLLTASGCWFNPEWWTPHDGDPPAHKAMIRVLHLSPDAPAVDVFAQSSIRVVEHLGFTESTEFLMVDPGTYDFDVVPAGGDAGDSVLAISDLPLEAGKLYTAVAYDRLASISALALADDFEGIPEGQFRVRAIHAAAGVGQVDIWVLPEGSEPFPLYENVDFGVVGGYFDLPAQSYTLGFDVDDDASPDLIFEIPALPAGTTANVFAVTDDSGAFLLAQLPDGTTARIDPSPMPEPEPEETYIRVLHLSPNAPAVDILVNGSLRAVEGLPFASGTEYLAIPPATYDFSVVPAGGMASDSVLDISGLPLEADTYYTAVAYDRLESISPLALVDDYSPLGAGEIRVRAIHAAAGVGQVDIWVLPADGSPFPLYENVDFGVAGGYYDLAAQPYTLGFDIDDDASPDLIFEIPALPEGTVANVFAVADESGAFLLAQLGDGATVRIDPTPPAPAEPASIRFLHLSPDAPAVDIYANAAGPIVADLVFSESSERFEVPSGTYDISIAPAGTSAAASVLDVNGIALEPGLSYSAAAFDTLDGIQAIALYNNQDDIADRKARIRAVHTAVGIGAVDLYVKPAWSFFYWWWHYTPSALDEGLDFGQAGAEWDVLFGYYRLGADVDRDGHVDAWFRLPWLSPGTYVNVFIATDAEGNPFLKLDTAQ